MLRVIHLLAIFATTTCAIPGPTPAPSPLPRPTDPQLLYQQHEIMALIHFNMATFARNGDPGCSADNWATNASYAAGPTNNPKTFNPSKLDTRQWVKVMQDLGAKHATLTAKHGCGFLLWPTTTTLPDGSPYGYDVGHGFGRNVLKEFSEATSEAGIGHGFYYSLTNNFYLNVAGHVAKNGSALPGQQSVTQEQFEAIALAQVQELWTEFGNLTEIWFDGGYTSDMKVEITTLLQENQPDATAFNGIGVTPNAVCWIGTESGNPGGEIWSTGGSGKGDPDSSVWCPKGCDTTLQDGDVWFYEKSSGIRTLAELIQVYHATVGRNGMLELDFAIDRDGLVAPTHAARYKELGDWIQSCYGANEFWSTGACTRPGPCVFEIAFNGTLTIDRAMVRERISEGQKVRSYKMELVSSAGTTIPLSSGSSVGNKRIDVIPTPVVDVTKARLTVLEWEGPSVYLWFSVFKPCPTA